MRTVSVTAALFASLGVTTAIAADLPTKSLYRAAAAPAVYDWSGFYIGGHVGYGWAKPDISPLTGGPISNTPRPNGFLGGGQAGFNWQRGGWVLGLETDASWGNLDDTRTCVSIVNGTTLSCRGAPKYFGTIDGRLGYAIDRALLYAKGGAAWSHEDFTQLGISPNCVGTPCTGSVFQWGWTVGAGLEYALARNWSAKIEYDFLDFDHRDTVTVSNGTSANVFSLTKTIHTLQLGVNYRF